MKLLASFGITEILNKIPSLKWNMKLNIKYDGEYFATLKTEAHMQCLQCQQK